MTERRTTHTRMMMREGRKLIYQGILIRLIVMMTGEW